MLIYVLCVWFLLKFSAASHGDRSPYFQRCIQKCHIRNCTREGDFRSDYTQPLHLKLALWYCDDECKYDCMWETVNLFHDNNHNTPQFYGKWPFIRMFGFQEPASVVFSLLNLYVHFKMLKRFMKVVRSDSPFYKMWIGYSVICCHAWFWSAIFHWRDTPATEFFDYSSAFSIILINCYVMSKRLLCNFHKFLTKVVTVFLLAIFSKHTMYLRKGKFDYKYHMQLNVFVGTCTAVCWFTWCLKHRLKQPYVWKCALYVTLTSFVLLLEVIDQPPLFYVFDSHALWHLATAPLVILIYSFAIDDCAYLRQLNLKSQQREKMD